MNALGGGKQNNGRGSRKRQGENRVTKYGLKINFINLTLIFTLKHEIINAYFIFIIEIFRILTTFSGI